uniref:Ammonium transporter AmtB-like domain-containing protein n=1 Tax=Chromera velia CCMP2878 TaxID=1169474 RepID=A0A0G4F7Q7_9ALVE|eukprot:Cvel_15596.t1-p1 / transcript=Cvel_15596.t1 / gene=Cvel_15596 / organism=Chromera_velia_CCMP2878 / gene_product=Putative ammonium transporter 1, putative / transcript_product=Putative ammonium transporter 1, putative / location=Cvel_scaffold1160:21848-25339(+) / protein_length=388 / sequence_SO=supercontig / SO=protein_coding / is_pseudo=false
MSAALEEPIRQFFLLIMGSMVFMMQTGFAFLCAGLIQEKNVVNILIKNLLDACVGAILYWLIGYGLAYGDGVPGNAADGTFLGTTKFALYNATDSDYADWFFQYTFCATAATIVSGALAERVNFYAYICYCIFLTGFVYPIVTHWGWTSTGYLTTLGYVDFAGFLAFNGGSVLNIASTADAVAVMKSVINTIIAGAAGCIFSLFFSATLTKYSKYSLIDACCGCLGGMVAICASANDVEIWAALIIGGLAGIWTIYFASLMQKMGLDDPVDAVAVHLAGGAFGVIMQAFFSKSYGIFYGNSDGGRQLGYQVAGLCAIVGWTAVTLGVVFFLLKIIGLLRVKEELEEAGLDAAKHGEMAYNMERSFYRGSGSGPQQKVEAVPESAEVEV